ncbi:MAG: DUF423 domain-containing protein [Acidiferrobacterales bacterium]|nr:DUF423 domain-containing protein [Acidiferrobacterales bacterium]
MKPTATPVLTICIELALGVILGAFGAHALEDRLAAAQQDTWETAVRYHFYHGLGALLIALLAQHRTSRLFVLAIRLHLAGILLFSGSLYLLATQSVLGADLSWLGPVTPLGGLAFVAGWIVAGWGFKTGQ